jgi:hypothetical protein
MEAYEAELLAQNLALKRFATTPRGRNLVSDALLARIRDDQARSLKATNARSRIAIARAATEELGALIDKGRLPPASFVTLSSKRFAVPIGDAGTFDVPTLIGWTAPWLEKLNHLTVVEAALYTKVPGWSGQVVSWHTHSIVWGASDWIVSSVVDGFNDQEEALVRGRTPAHVRALASEKTVSNRVIYMLKAPMKDYRVYPIAETVVDHLGGEIIQRETGTDQQRKRDLRPGDLVKIYDVLGDRHIPSLMFGGGKGIALRDRIVARGLAYVTPSLGTTPMILPRLAKSVFG